MESEVRGFGTEIQLWRQMRGWSLLRHDTAEIPHMTRREHLSQRHCIEVWWSKSLYIETGIDLRYQKH